MDKRDLDDLAGDPRFIPGIYNYCDRWCERCPFTGRCLKYAMRQEMGSGGSQGRDAEREARWDMLHDTADTMRDMIEDRLGQMEFDLKGGLREAIRAQGDIHEAAAAQPCSRTALRYIKIVDAWFQAHEGLLDDKNDELKSPAPAGVPGTEPVPGPVDLQDCLEVVRWYQHQIYVKLRRAATGMIRGELEGNEYHPQDANGSAKVALLGIERSIAAWATLQRRFPDHEDIVLALGTLQRLLRQVEAAFPDARAFRRPGFDTTEGLD